MEVPEGVHDVAAAQMGREGEHEQHDKGDEETPAEGTLGHRVTYCLSSRKVIRTAVPP